MTTNAQQIASPDLYLNKWAVSIYLKHIVWFMEKTIKMLAIAFLILSSIDPVYAQLYIHPKNSNPGFLAESEHFRFYSH